MEGIDRRTVIRRKFEANLLRAAAPGSKIFYVRRADECVCLDYEKGERIWNVVLLPHPDVTLEEFLS